MKDRLLHAPQFITGWNKPGTRARDREPGGADLILLELTAL
jgi:hypothetical protein